MLRSLTGETGLDSVQNGETSTSISTYITLFEKDNEGRTVLLASEIHEDWKRNIYV